MTLLLVASGGAIAAEKADEGEIFKDERTAARECFSLPDIKDGWRQGAVGRGADYYFLSLYERFNARGWSVGHSWTKTSVKHTGMVLAVPIGDFEQVAAFRFWGRNRHGARCVQTGLVVRVGVQLSVPNRAPDDYALERTVENLVNSGMALPKVVGCSKAGRILPLKESAKRRFGARAVRVRYDGQYCRVELLLLDCRPEEADASFLPATLEGMSRDRRVLTGRVLKKSPDRGGSFYFGPRVLTPQHREYWR